MCVGKSIQTLVQAAKSVNDMFMSPLLAPKEVTDYNDKTFAKVLNMTKLMLLSKAI